MSSNNNDSGTMFAGGIIVVIIVIMFSLKAIEKIMVQLSKTFNAFGSAMASFGQMAFNVLLVLALLAAAIGCVYAAVYFTYRYYKMVKAGTDLKQLLDERFFDLDQKLFSELRAKQSDFDYRIRLMEKKLKSALDRPELTPPAKVQLPTTPAAADLNVAAKTTDSLAEKPATAQPNESSSATTGTCSVIVTPDEMAAAKENTSTSQNIEPDMSPRDITNPF